MRMLAIAPFAVALLYAAPSLAQTSATKTGDVDREVDLPKDCPLGQVHGSAARKAAGKWFAKGELLIAEEQYEDAVQAFMCSFKLVQHPNTLFNTAQAAMLLGNTPLALEMLRRYMEEAPDGPMASDVAQRIAELEAQIRATTPEPPPAPKVETVEPLPPPPEPPPLQPPAPAPEKTSWKRPASIAAFGLAGAAAVTGVVLHALAGAAQSQAQSTDRLSEFNAQKDKMSGLQTGAIVCYGIAGAALTAGIVLLATDKKERADNPVSLGPTSLRVEF